MYSKSGRCNHFSSNISTFNGVLASILELSVFDCEWMCLVFLGKDHQFWRFDEHGIFEPSNNEFPLDLEFVLKSLRILN